MSKTKTNRSIVMKKNPKNIFTVFQKSTAIHNPNPLKVYENKTTKPH